MNDSTDGLKVSALENVNAKYLDSVTVSNNDLLVCIKDPEFIEPVIMNTPRYQAPINPEYEKLGEIARQAVIQTLLDGEKTHGADEWEKLSYKEHREHAINHLLDDIAGDKSELHPENALTRLTMMLAKK
jgi:hypothetical protein